MTEEERNNAEVQKKLALQDAKFNIFVEEMREFKNDMKAAQVKHDAEMKDIRNEIKDVRNEIKDIRNEMKDIRSEIQGTIKHIQNLVLASMGLTIAAVVGILAITVGVLGFLWTTAKNMENQAQSVQTQSIYQMPPEQSRQ